MTSAYPFILDLCAGSPCKKKEALLLPRSHKDSVMALKLEASSFDLVCNIQQLIGQSMISLRMFCADSLVTCCICPSDDSTEEENFRLLDSGLPP
jgi:hypothetical protein